jgi:hypothetical protein
MTLDLGKIKDLEEAISSYRQALDLRSLNHSDHGFWPSASVTWTPFYGPNMFILCGVYPRMFGPQVDPSMIPSTDFLKVFPPRFMNNATRGRKITFSLYQYDIDPSEASADSLAPSVCSLFPPLRPHADYVSGRTAERWTPIH